MALPFYILTSNAWEFWFLCSHQHLELHYIFFFLAFLSPWDIFHFFKGYIEITDTGYIEGNSLETEGKSKHFICNFSVLFGFSYVYKSHLKGQQNYGPLFLVLSVHSCFKIHNTCLTVLLLFPLGSKCQPTYLTSLTPEFMSKKSLQVS